MNKEELTAKHQDAVQKAQQLYDAYQQTLGAALVYGDMLKRLEESEHAEELKKSGDNKKRK